MDTTEIVEGANQIHPTFDGRAAPRQHPRPSPEDRQSTAEGAIQPFDERRVQHLAARRRPQQRQEQSYTPVDKAMDGAGHRSARVLFHHLRNHQIWPAYQAWTSAGAGLARPKGAPHHINVGLQSIGHEQQRAEAGTGGYQCHQAFNQGAVATRTDSSTQPQACRHHQCHRHPQYASLGLETDLVGLDMRQVKWLHDLMVMEAFTLLTRRLYPFPHALGLEAKGGFDGRNGASVADQRDDTGDECLIGATAKEERPSPRAERLPTHLALEAWPGLAMDANVSLSGLPSCRTLHIRAEYIWRMHRLLLVFGDTQDIVGSFATFSSAGGQITV